ncbi:MAG: hypothetical protein NTZ14_05430 [Hyphomicrobiales bacterium]|nr:hypothetical protein [Hyphomicrobiales bacterium]
MSAVSASPRARRPWLLILLLLLAALLQAGTWAGLGMGAFVLWNSIHAFYFQHSYVAGMLPLGMAGLLALTIVCLLFRQLRWATIPAFAAMILSFVMLPRMGTISLLSPFIHPMQLVHWGAMALTWGGCLWLFILGNRAASART